MGTQTSKHRPNGWQRCRRVRRRCVVRHVWQHSYCTAPKVWRLGILVTCAKQMRLSDDWLAQCAICG